MTYLSPGFSGDFGIGELSSKVLHGRLLARMHFIFSCNAEQAYALFMGHILYWKD